MLLVILSASSFVFSIISNCIISFMLTPEATNSLANNSLDFFPNL